MIRNLKVLGLALAAVFAFSAMSASAASAEKLFHSESEKTILTGTEVEEVVFDAGGGTIKCPESVYDATTSAKTVTEITVEPTYKTEKCKAFGLETHVLMNGCDYVFTLEPGTTETTGGSTHTSGPVHIKCPEGKKIELTVTKLLGGSRCTVDVPAQTPTKPTVDYKNEGKEKTRDVLITSTIEGVTYEVTGGGGICGVEGHHNDGKLTGSATTKCYEDLAGPKEGNQVGCWVE